MKFRNSSLVVLIFLIGVAIHAREPLTSPPPVPSTIPAKIVRARDLGIPFEGTPGKFNAITDVAGVKVGYTTLIRGEGKLVAGQGPVRTGVTAVLPRGSASLDDPVYAGVFSLNGNGEMTGTAWVEESGFLEGPVLITNTHSVGVARDAVIQWRVKRGGADPGGFWWSLPVVAETWDGPLNDINGFHVKPEHVFQAVESAHGGAIEEGSVGGGTGMVCYQFKGGTGTASRTFLAERDDRSAKKEARRFAVGVLVQANHGIRPQLTIAGVPVGREIPKQDDAKKEAGSIIIVVATDAPLLPHQLKRLARRASLGLARTGSVSGNGSGDLFIAFSTANPGAANPKHQTRSVETIPNDHMDPIFNAVVQATEEAIINALVNQNVDTVSSRVWQEDKATGRHFYVGRDDYKVEALPHDRVRELLKKYNRLQ